MARTHAQQLANETLPRAVFQDPLAFTRAIAGDEAPGTLATLWGQAGAELAPIARMASTGLTATFARRGLYVTVVVVPPPPRESGDPAAMVIVGRGDGTSKLTTLAYYVLELVLDPATGAPSFVIAARNGRGDREALWREAPLPDPHALAEHVFELYAGRTPSPHAGVLELPSWYWWFVLDGATAMRTFGEAPDDERRFEVVRKTPILLMPEILAAAEHYDAKPIRRLRELRPYLLRATSLAPTWRALTERLASANGLAAAAHAARTIPLIGEAVQHGALGRAQGYELEAAVRARLATLGIDPALNYELSEQLHAAARAAEAAPRLARGSEPPPVNTEDPVWRPVFLDETELPQHVRAERDETSSDPAFAAHGGLRAGHAAWVGDASSPMARVVDSRWVFTTATGAASFMRAFGAGFGDGLPAVAAPAFGDETLAFGGDVTRAQVLVIRIGRIVARLLVAEGAQAAAARHVLHAAMLHPLASKIAQRARYGLAAYWLAVASPSNAVPALVHSSGYDAARLLPQYPLLAHVELPSALATLGEPYAPAARALASFQAQLRAHRWATYREAMLALVRSLLASDLGDARVNAAHAHEIVTELRYLDPDPIWLQLDAECRARS